MTKKSMPVKEEITDLFNPSVYDDRNEWGKYVFYKGRVLVFNFEGSTTNIKITRIDRKNKRMWGEHIELHDQNIVRSHYRHNVDATVDPPFCTDCEVPVSEPATEDGEKKYLDRKDQRLADGTPIE